MLLAVVRLASVQQDGFCFRCLFVVVVCTIREDALIDDASAVVSLLQFLRGFSTRARQRSP